MLSNKVALITGSSRGIGREIALTFADNGANIIINSKDDNSALSAVKAELEEKGGDVTSVLGDVSDPQFCKDCVKQAIKKFGKIDILVNCAGIISRADYMKMSETDWRHVLDVNLSGAMNMSREVLGSMVDIEYGRIINITSQMAHLPHPSAAPSYEVSKAGLNALTRHLAVKFAKHRICVNSIAPGSINTDLPKSMSEEQRENLQKKIPMGRLGEPFEVANCALFLASELSSYVTGSTIHVNGGSYMP